MIAGYPFAGDQFKAADTNNTGYVMFTNILRTWYPQMHARYDNPSTKDTPANIHMLFGQGWNAWSVLQI